MEKITLKQKVSAAIVWACLLTIPACAEHIGMGFILLGVCVVACWIGDWLKEA